MNTFKKIGLTALASSLVVTSAVAGEMSVAGGASIGVKNTSNTTGKSFTMGNQLTFSGSGELDNGMNVSLSFVIDQGDDTAIASGPFDSHSVTISSDAMGTLKFSGEGGSSAQSALDTTAAGDLWDNGSGFGSPASSEAGNNSMLYTLPTLMDDLSIQASYSPGGAAKPNGAHAFGATFTGVEGLSASIGVGESETLGSEAETTTMKASYAISSFTVAYSNTEHEYDLGSASDEEVTSWKLSYTVSDDLSISYGEEEHETEGSAIDEEADSVSISYTTGGVTLTAAQYDFSGTGNASVKDIERWALSASFAF